MSLPRLGTWTLALLAALLLLLLYAVDLGAGSVWNTDDALYAYLVRKMAHARSFTIPPWFDYDLGAAYPFGVGYMAAVARVFGADVAGLRASALLAALLGLLALPWLARGRAGWLAAGLLAVQPLAFLLSQRVLHDQLLCALTIAAMSAYHRGREPGHGAHLVGAGVACALASLTKMGAGLLPLAAIGLDVVLFERRLLRRGATWAGAAVAVAAPVAWFALHGELRGIAGALEHRVTVELAGHGAAAARIPGAATISTILAGGPPAYAVLGLAAVGAVVGARRRLPLARLALAWLATVALALAVMRTYLPQYALAVLPPLAVLAGIALDAAITARPWAGPAAALLVVALLPWPAGQAFGARHADDRVAQLAARQARAAPGALLCTVDLYHAASVLAADRAVLYLTEDARSRAILHRTFGEETVPTLAPGDVAARLDAAPSVSCLLSRARLRELAPSLRGAYATIEPDPARLGPDVVLLER